MRVLGFMILLAVQTCAAQQAKVGGPCEGCEAIYECPVPFDELKPTASLPDLSWEGKKPIGIHGTVYKADGITPAPGVVIYLYHTDESGHYPKKGNEEGWAKRHGYVRGWVKTDERGFYKIGSLRPAPYPGKKEPAHVHMVVKEPDLNEYYIDEMLFSDDPLLTPEIIASLPERGGSGIVKIVDVGNMFKGSRDIYLGKNIPDYPVR